MSSGLLWAEMRSKFEQSQDKNNQIAELRGQRGRLKIPILLVGRRSMMKFTG